MSSPFDLKLEPYLLKKVPPLNGPGTGGYEVPQFLMRALLKIDARWRRWEQKQQRRYQRQKRKQ